MGQIQDTKLNKQDNFSIFTAFLQKLSDGMIESLLGFF